MSEKLFQYGTARAETTSFQLAEGAGSLQRLDGYCNGANTFVQLHDSIGAPAANAVPLKSLQVFGNDGFSYLFLAGDEVVYQNGLYLVLSTSEVNYVADASGTKVSGDGTIQDIAGLKDCTTVGDYTTQRSNLQVWTDASGPKHLKRLYIANNEAAQDLYFFVVAQDATPVGMKVVMIAYVPQATTKVVSFGDGLVPYEQVSQALHHGCTVRYSINAPSGDVSPAFVNGSNVNIKAWYTA